MTDLGQRLPNAVAHAIAHPASGRTWSQDAAGYSWRGLEWGHPSDPPIVLVHGVTSDSGTFWRVGAALAASGRFVVALDLPGHGGTGGWRGRHRFEETASDIVELLQTRGLLVDELAVLGHSLGARTVAALPAVGLSPRPLILLDPPALTLDELDAMSHDPEEAVVLDPEEGLARIRGLHPDWTDGDVAAKATGLGRFEPEAVRSLLVDNGEWDACLEQLGHPGVRPEQVWLIRGDPGSGGLTPDALVPRFEAVIGAEHVITIPGGPHSPQRTHIEATVRAILRALTSGEATSS